MNQKIQIPNDKLDFVIFLYKNMTKIKFESEISIEGFLPSCIDFDEVESAFKSHKIVSDLKKDTRKLSFKIAHVRFYLSIDRMLSLPSFRILPIGNEPFYIADMDYLHGTSDKNPVIENYFRVARFFSSLRKIADHENKSGPDISLIFLHNKKLEITSSYTEGDLILLNNSSWFENNFIYSEIHKDQKVTIIKTVLFELFENCSKINFSGFLKNYNEFIERVNSGYQLYVSEFSFQKIKSEIEKEKLEFVTRLNKVFSDIQNQLLAIPAALILIGGQMEPTGNWSIKNLLIWAGALVFSFLMNLLISNQSHTLRAIKDEIKRQWSLIKGDHRGIADQFHKSYESLYCRYRHQWVLLQTVSFLVASALVFASGMLLVYSIGQEKSVNAVIFGVYVGVPVYVIYLIVRSMFTKSGIFRRD